MIGALEHMHPILVHFTVALLLTGSVLYVIAALISGRNDWRQTCLTAARLNLWIGGLVTVLTVSAGFVAYYTVAHDIPSHEAMTDHRNWALISTVVFLLLAILSFLRRHSDEPSRLLAVSLVAACVLLGITGLKGGELVYRYGLAVQSLPQADSHNHGAGAPGHSQGASQNDTHMHDNSNEADSKHSH